MGPIVGMAVAGLALLGLGAVAPPSFMAHFTVFVLACFVGYMVIWNVTRGAAHAAHERHQRYLEHHRDRCTAADQLGCAPDQVDRGLAPC